MPDGPTIDVTIGIDSVSMRVAVAEPSSAPLLQGFAPIVAPSGFTGFTGLSPLRVVQTISGIQSPHFRRVSPPQGGWDFMEQGRT